MNEWLMIAAMGVGGIGFASGGTGIKPLRRYVMPFLLGLIAYFSGAIWWRALGLWIGLSVAMHLPYGERTPWPVKCLVFLSFFLPTLFLRFSPWLIIGPVLTILIFFLSNWKPTAGIFVWKVCEFLFGVLIGISICLGAK